jgi:hypothetical protein
MHVKNKSYNKVDENTAFSTLKHFKVALAYTCNKDGAKITIVSLPHGHPLGGPILSTANFFM